jgi:hypothetical protein
MQFTQMLKDRMRDAAPGSSPKVYLKTSDGTEFRGTVAAVGDDFVEIRTDQGRAYAVMVDHIVFAGF